MNAERLLELKLINYDEFEAYVLFHNSEMGYAWLEKMIKLTYLDEPAPDNPLGEVFAYMSGRCSPFRNIILMIDKVNDLIRNNVDDNGTEDK